MTNVFVIPGLCFSSYIPEDGGFRFGTYGVHQRTFTKLRDKLERVAKKYGLP